MSSIHQRRDHVGVDRLEEVGSPRRAAWPVSAIERESCVHSSSSVKSHGVVPRPRLDDVERERARGRRQRAGPRPSTRSSRVRRALAAHARRRRPCAHQSPVAPRTTRGSRSISRRTKRHVTPASAQAATTSVEPLARRVRDRHEHDVRRGALEDRGHLVGRRRGPGRRARAGADSCGSSSTKPTTRSPGVSRSSRSRLRPLRPAPTISVRCALARSRSA